MRFKVDASATGQAAVERDEDEVRDLIHWDAGIELGIKVFDSQHRRLVKMINRLNRAMKLKKSRDAIAGIFTELVAYTQTHFGDEEEMMRKYSFDGLSDQEGQHQRFAKKMNELQQQVKAGNAMVTMDLMDFLKDWLVKHIQRSDKGYQAFFKSKGVA